MTILCAMKWVVGFLATPGLIVGALGSCALALFIVYLLFMLADRTLTRWAPTRYERAIAWCDQHSNRAVAGLYGVVLIGFALWWAPAFVQRVFGCDECLPAEMRKACVAQTEEQLQEQERKDRETFDALREKYGW